mmetsp:Transcript_147072/g.208572  ORF Transcript_147072/g.208572 Transcript_147072/m.208572 type:complete len:113 (+) Transcript_147072:55-393(+)
MADNPDFSRIPTMRKRDEEDEPNSNDLSKSVDIDEIKVVEKTLGSDKKTTSESDKAGAGDIKTKKTEGGEEENKKGHDREKSKRKTQRSKSRKTSRYFNKNEEDDPLRVRES